MVANNNGGDGVTIGFGGDEAGLMRTLGKIERDIVASMAAATRNVESQITQVQKSLAGDTLGAEIEGIKRHFAQQIESAQQANDAELADRLATLRQLRISEAQFNAEKQRMRAADLAAAQQAARLEAAAAQQAAIAKQQAQERSIMARGAVQLLAGGGAAAGLTMLARRLDDAVSKAGELVDKFQDGELSAGEMAGEVIKLIPLIGDFAKLGENIRNQLDGTAQALRDQQAGIDAMTKRYEIMLDAAQRRLAIERELAGVVKERERAVELRGLEGLDRDLRQVDMTAADDTMKVREKAEAAIKAENEALSKRGDLIRQEGKAAAEAAAERARHEANQGGGNASQRTARAIIADRKARAQAEAAMNAQLVADRQATEQRITKIQQDAAKAEAAINADRVDQREKLKQADIAEEDRKRKAAAEQKQKDEADTNARVDNALGGFFDDVGRQLEAAQREAAKIRDDMAVGALEAQGRTAEARVLRIAQEFGAKIDDATAKGDADLADALTQRRNQLIEAERKGAADDDDAAKGRVDALARPKFREPRFTSLEEAGREFALAGLRPKDDAQRKQLEQAQQAAKNTGETVKRLDKLIEVAQQPRPAIT